LIVADPNGRLGIDLGVTGAPETYLIDAGGVIRHRYQGALDERVWQREFEPLLQRLAAERTP
jgi:cytochrome c biogenesis protein CcmG/thiol:disulfide interchange protein DsbE